MIPSNLIMPEREQLLIVKDPGHLADLVRDRYPRFNVAVTDNYLDGIAALSRGTTRGLLVGVDPTARKLVDAVAGLRKAAGASSRIVLCCPPSGEPLARRVLPAGANDYLIYPPDGDELDHALDLSVKRPVSIAISDPVQPMPTWEEVSRLTGILQGMGDRRSTLLARLCQMVADTMRTPFVRIVAEPDEACVGNANTEPILIESILSGDRDLGIILVGPRRRSPFTSAEVEKLRHYSRIIAHLLEAADRQQEWHRLALIDEVTQLPNRRYLMQAMDSLVRQAERERFHLTTVMFDLDGFKHFNDTYGHSAGDQILRETAKLLRHHCRQHDIVARYAGDEFVAVLWDAEEPRIAGSQHPNDALKILSRFKRALGSHEFPKLGSEAKGCITISGGLATFPWDSKDVEGLLERADQAMLQAKRDGKNRIYLVGDEQRCERSDPEPTDQQQD